MALSLRMFRYLMMTQPDEQIFFPPLHVQDENTERLVDSMRGNVSIVANISRYQLTGNGGSQNSSQ